jgi:hypothetical protein
MSKRYRVSRVAMAGCAGVLLAAGCGGADFGESVTVPQEKHTQVDDAFGAGRTLRLPAEVPFNVTDAQRFSSGDAAAESSTDASGKARCAARAGAGGKAWAEFQLGHVLANRGAKPFAATVTFNVAYAYRVNGETSSQPATPDKFALKVYVMDSNRRMLKRMMLAELEPSKGPAVWDGTQTPAFDVTFEPGLAYHLVLAARAEVSGDPERSPSAELEVRSLAVDIVPKS